jgi:hypothetical protein
VVKVIEHDPAARVNRVWTQYCNGTTRVILTHGFTFPK